MRSVGGIGLDDGWQTSLDSDGDLCLYPRIGDDEHHNIITTVAKETKRINTDVSNSERQRCRREDTGY